MANRIYIVPRRNDLEGMLISLGDLHPNAGQKNSIYQGAHQNVYMVEGLDPLAATVVSSTSWVSGSRNTTLAADAVADDTTGGGNDVTAMAATTFGLAAYIKDRVQDGGTASAVAPQMPWADCNAIAQAIMTSAMAGGAMTLAGINTIILLTAVNSNLAGAGISRSFGTVDDILRILSGEVYTLPELTIIENVLGQFQTLAQRTVFTDAQTVAFITAQGQFEASGDFLAADAAGYRARASLVRTGSANISLASGKLAAYTTNTTMVVLNPVYAYTAAAVTAIKTRATLLDTTAVPEAGTGILCHVYLNDGTNLG